MSRLLIATRNPGKFAEFSKCFSDLPLTLVSLSDLGITEDAPEDEPTFVGNALQKAQFYYRISGLPTVADDAGLEIDALNGEPGVKSRRWAGHRMEDRELLDYALEKIKALPNQSSSCHFTACLAFVWDGGETTEEEQIQGECRMPQREGLEPGYPFRSIFFLPELKKYYIDLTEEEHAAYNHRRKAALRLRTKIQQALV